MVAVMTAPRLNPDFDTLLSMKAVIRDSVLFELSILKDAIDMLHCADTEEQRDHMKAASHRKLKLMEAHLNRILNMGVEA
jgi:hypothetical protein